LVLALHHAKLKLVVLEATATGAKLRAVNGASSAVPRDEIGVPGRATAAAGLPRELVRRPL